MGRSYREINFWALIALAAMYAVLSVLLGRVEIGPTTDLITEYASVIFLWMSVLLTLVSTAIWPLASR